jgi:hypothetical protein
MIQKCNAMSEFDRVMVRKQMAERAKLDTGSSL